jgi:hypothetical protein
MRSTPANNTEYMKARSCASPGEAEEAVAALAGQVLSVTSKVKFFQFLRPGLAMRSSSNDSADL